jgi:hypothetical protein
LRIAAIASRSPENDEMDCRPACAACCIAPSMTSPIPGLDGPKPAGQPCPQLDADLRCRLFGRPERPAVCGSLQPSPAMCGSGRGHALRWLARLDAATAP